MSRILKYDIPGEDWRLEPEAARRLVRERGWLALFAGLAPPPKRLILDVGFGRGEFLMGLARAEPESGFLGIEISFKRTLKMARRLARSEVRNVRLIEASAQQAVLLLPPNSVACCWINFPDPWPKKRHHRRRLIAPAFVGDLARRLEPHGLIHVATDHDPYAEQAGAVLAAESRLENVYAPEPFRSSVPGRQRTAYEAEWLAQGRSLRFFSYRRIE